jgi:hypothetical protein
MDNHTITYDIAPTPLIALPVLPSPEGLSRPAGVLQFERQDTPGPDNRSALDQAIATTPAAGIPSQALEVLKFKLKKESRGIYRELARHQGTEKGWDSKELAAELLRWVAIYDEEFDLDVPEVSLSIDFTHRLCYGHFRYGHNGFGLKGEILINKHYVSDREGWKTLGTLLHEMLHGWQQAHGKPGKGKYHNKQFRHKAETLGLIVDHWGHTQYAPDSAFTRLLEKHGVHVPPLGKPVLSERQPGESKLKKWSCGCTNVRVAIVDFRARCLKCKRLFSRV